MSFTLRGVAALVIALALPVGGAGTQLESIPAFHIPKPPPGFWDAIGHWLEGGGAKKIAHALSDGKYAEQIVATFSKTPKFKSEVKALKHDEHLFDEDPLCAKSFHPSEQSLNALAKYFQADSGETDSRGWVPIRQTAKTIHGQITSWIAANLNKHYPKLEEKRAVLINVDHFRELYCVGHEVVASNK